MAAAITFLIMTMFPIDFDSFDARGGIGCFDMVFTGLCLIVFESRTRIYKVQHAA